MSKVKFEVEVYTYQIDFVGHVNNIVYIQWMEIGRLKLLEALGLPISELAKTNIAPVLVETNIKYKKSVSIEDKVKIEVWFSDLMNATAIMEFRFYNVKGDLVATGLQKGLFINRKTMKVHRMTFEERKALEKFLEKE
ncbi:long-chain acyl-CoA thioesterase FadM [bacterium BMS3Abin04]|nr:long-chain acyl-CoA thioesterase FadM [bacterium BMS3Abin04]